MAKEPYDWIKLALDNKWLVIMLFTGFSSVVTNATQFISGQDKDIEIQATHKQIAEIANHYAAPKTVTVKSNCDKCMYEVRKLRKEYH